MILSTPRQCGNLHTSKRMHFIEEIIPNGDALRARLLHTSKRMHFIEESQRWVECNRPAACIRQNVCTSLRIGR